MQKLAAQHEERQQQQAHRDNQEEDNAFVFEPILKNATNMVTKLLLIALNLETDCTEDYDEQLAANLPLTSQFLLCRTIHIEDRGGSRDDNDDDDGNQEAYRIMPTEDAGLVHVLRVTFAAAMVHASKTNNPKLHMPGAFLTCTCTTHSSSRSAAPAEPQNRSIAPPIA
jgi:hypothetical protein